LTIATEGGAGEIAFDGVDVYTIRGQGDRRTLTVKRKIHGSSPREFTSEYEVQCVLWPQ
jgi:hypothetical protein